MISEAYSEPQHPYCAPKEKTPAASPLSTQVGGSHYKGFVIEPVEFIYANDIPFIEGCALKYLCRWRDKGGIADLEKAKHFIEILIELETKKGLEKAR